MTTLLVEGTENDVLNWIIPETIENLNGVCGVECFQYRGNDGEYHRYIFRDWAERLYAVHIKREYEEGYTIKLF